MPSKLEKVVLLSLGVIEKPIIICFCFIEGLVDLACIYGTQECKYVNIYVG